MMQTDEHVTASAIRELVADLKALPPRPDDEQNLEPEQIEKLGGPSARTQATWRSTGRYAWPAVCVHIGRNVKVKRRAYRAWEMLRSGLYQLAA